MITRRDLLLSALSTSALVTILGARAWSGIDLKDNRGQIIFGSGSHFIRLDPANGWRQTVDTPTRAHSFSLVPGERHLVLGLEKWGRKLSLVDFHSERVVKTIEPSAHRLFYGHICWTRDGHHFISPQTDLLTEQGYLVWYDRVSLQAVDEVVLARGGAHDLKFMPEKDILALTVGGLALDYKQPLNGAIRRVGNSTIAFYDTKKRGMLRESVLQRPGTFPGHLQIGSKGQIYFVTSLFSHERGQNLPRHGGVYDLFEDQKIREWEIPEKVKETLKGELLSLEINEAANRLVVTNPGSSQLLIFNLETRSWIGSEPTVTSGVAWDRAKKTLYGFGPVNGKHHKELNGFSFESYPTFLMSSHILFTGPDVNINS